METVAKIRILFIVPRYGTVRRGVESFAHELLCRLNSEKFEITVISDDHFESIDGIRFIQYPLWRRERFSWILRLPRYIRRLLDLIDLGSPSDIESLSLRLHAVRRLDGEFFDLAVPLGGSWSYRLARRITHRVLSIGQAGPVRRDLERSDLFVALTPFDQDRAQRMCPNLQTYLIPNGVDVSRFQLAGTTPKSDSGYRILCVAALVDDKRHDLLFDAVLCLPETVRVTCIGDGPAKRKLSNHVLVRAGRVEFRSVPYGQMHLEYEAANVFSLASPDEAFGIAFVEAMATGLPIVANDGPRQRYVVGEYGFFCNVHDPKAYSLALAEALKITPRPEVRSQACDRFSWQQISKEYASLFDKVASNK